MAATTDKVAAPTDPTPIKVAPDVFARLQEIAAEQAVSIDMAAHMVLAEALQRTGHWPAGAGDAAAADRTLRDADDGHSAGE